MSRISSLMTIGRRSMMNSQTGLHTVGHNIANKETEGFSRQRVETVTNYALGSGKRRMGMGARAATVRRVNNPYLERQITSEMSDLATAKGRQQGLSRLEQIYNEQMVEGLSRSFAKFFNSFRELSTNPESMPRRTAVKESATVLVNDLHNIDTQLDEVAADINSQMKVSVDELNSYTHEIAVMNNKIQEVEITGGWANDERDRRDHLIKKLGEIVDIKWAEGEDSTVTVSTANDAILVVGGDAKRIEAVASSARPGKDEGDYDLYYFHHDFADPLLITDRIQGGRLGGLVDVRSGELAGLKQDMDKLAFTVANEVNKYHVQGFNSYNQSGNLFFEPLTEMAGAAEYVALSSEVMTDVGRIAAGADPNRPGDNRIANEIAELQYRKPMFDGHMSLDEFYNGIVGELGIKTAAANRDVEVQDNIVKQLNHMRESISGVSLDEEAAKMIEYQKHFDAAARLIRTADEVLETVINLKRY